MKTDILAIGAHPDDVELAAGGTLALYNGTGLTTGIIDLTKGELGTRGNSTVRMKEATAAAKILGVAFRENVGLKDGLFTGDEKEVMKLLVLIRKYKPRIVICNAVNDRHPDHGRASGFVSRVCFLSGLRKIQSKYKGVAQDAFRPQVVYHYIQDRFITPDVVVDITRTMEVKMKAIKAFSSQFYDPRSKEPATPISGKDFLDFQYGRCAEMGRLINVQYGEGFTTERPVGLKSFLDIQ
jgi:bacillithiol biosynthesis deacetylase BshB1